MGGLKVALIFGIICLALSQATGYEILSKSVPEVRLNITSGEFAELCQLNKQNLNKNLKEARNSLAIVSIEINKKIQNIVKDEDSSEKLNEALNKHCLENFDLKEALKKLLNDVQLCYNEKDNLSDSEEENVVEKAAFAHCFGGIKYSIIRKLYKCIGNEKTKSAIAKCYEDPLNLFNSPYELLYPLPIIRTQAQCKIALQSANCQINIVKKYCRAPVSNIFKSLVNDYRKLSDC